MLSSSWVLEEPSTYFRPLGVTEQMFYLDGLFQGTADSAVLAEIELLQQGSRSIISRDIIERAWISLKIKYPLLGARIIERSDKSLWFSVDENRLHTCGPREIHFHDVASAEEALEIFSNIPNSARLLSSNLLACLFIFRRTDTPNRFHIIFHAAHTITDGNTYGSLLRTFLSKLASNNTEIETWNIRSRLALASSCDDLNPFHDLTPIRQRWRLAIGAVIWRNRASKLQGGHTLPCKTSNITGYQPARSGNVIKTFSKDDTETILRECRRLGTTFGAVYPVIGQVALCRVLCRKYTNGEISETEWEFRKREPMITNGPINLRPFLDKEWYENGGATNASLAISFFFYQLRFMPLGLASGIKPGDPVPSYDDLLSRKRFVYRSELIKKEVDRVLRSPLKYEIDTAMFPGFIANRKDVIENWRQKVLLSGPSDRCPWSVKEMAANGAVLGFGGSSFGNTDTLTPEYYPLSGGQPVLRHDTTIVSLHARPRELYLGAGTGRGKLWINVYYDKNVYEAPLVKEWLDEVEAAIRHYLVPREVISSRL